MTNPLVSKQQKGDMDHEAHLKLISIVKELDDVKGYI